MSLATKHTVGKNLAGDFLQALFGQAIDDKLGKIGIWRKDKKLTSYFSRVEEAAKFAEDAACKTDVYVAVGVQPPGLPMTNRATGEQVTAICGLWADIDIGRGKNSKHYPPTEADALDLIDALGLPASGVLRSGGGLHPWWPLDEPWILADEGEREHAKKVCRGLVMTLQAIAGRNGWSLDSVGDLARIMRVPGTLNHKFSPPRTVEWLKPIDAKLRFGIDDVEGVLVDEVARPPAAAPGVNMTAAPKNGARLAEQLAVCDSAFARTWDRNRTDLADQSASGYDLAIANEGVCRGWTDDQIAGAMRAWRVRHGEDATKIDRGDYVMNTIAKARAGYDGHVGNNGSSKAPTGKDIITVWFAERYGPVFHRGTAIYSAKLGREVKQSEACGCPTSEVIQRLAKASDAPQTDGHVRRQALPNFFQTWARVAWGDLLTTLPHESDISQTCETASEQFRAMMSRALHALVSLGHDLGKDSSVKVERRSLIGWCDLFAKDKWARIRSLACWCRRSKGGPAADVAIRPELFSQLSFNEPVKDLTSTKFSQLCAAYGVGQTERIHADGQQIRAVVIDPEFIDEIAPPRRGASTSSKAFD